MINLHGHLHNEQVALKSMMVIHRTLREGDPTFRDELLNYARNRGHVLNLSNFKDDSSPSGEIIWFLIDLYNVLLQPKRFKLNNGYENDHGSDRHQLYFFYFLSLRRAFRILDSTITSLSYSQIIVLWKSWFNLDVNVQHGTTQHGCAHMPCSSKKGLNVAVFWSMTLKPSAYR